jgi:peptidyl-prolyl cis-trans isomerase D
VPQAADELTARYIGDKRNVDYFVLSAAALPPVAVPTDAELETYLKDNQKSFRTEETRTIDVLVLSADAIAATKTVADADVAAEYERTKASLTKVEKRTIKQVALATADQIKAFEDGKAGGKKIGQMLAETALPFQDLGTLAKTDVPDSALADAAFGLAVDDFVIIDGVAGAKRAITVSAIEPGGVLSLEEATPDIRKALALKAARADYGDLQDQIEELRAAFKPLADIGTRFGLVPQTLTVKDDVATLAPLGALAEADLTKIKTTVMGAKEGDLTPAVPLAGNSYLWFDLKAIEPARDQTLAEVKDAVTKAWTDQQTADALSAKVTALLEQLKAGTAFADVATSVNQVPQLSPPLGRNGDGTAVLNTQVAEAIFAGGEGYFGSAMNGDGDHVLFQVTGIVPGSVDALTSENKTFVENSLRDTLYADFVTGVRDEAGIRINQQALSKVLGLDQTGQ